MAIIRIASVSHDQRRCFVHNKKTPSTSSAASNHSNASPNHAGIGRAEAGRKTDGVKDATVNFMALKMKVEFEEGVDPVSVMEQVRTNCKKIEDDMEIFL